jgi:TolA-binding protein
VFFFDILNWGFVQIYPPFLMRLTNGFPPPNRLCTGSKRSVLCSSAPASTQEQNRRRNLVHEIRNDVRQVTRNLNKEAAIPVSPSKAIPIASLASSFGGSQSKSVSNHPRPNLVSYDNQEILQLQTKYMSAQDQVVDQLGSVTQRLKNIGLQMNEELETQNEMLDEMRDNVNRADQKIHRGTKVARRIGRG